ncbi:Preprotein translocase subunit sece1 [Thalictrum thalictroides]|uniref:Preprotein translocase subunit sece1 n=1 Tax=Thalictrum thalictroides TaxID=46969 RepID=A0A7J6UU86_THATH|nr:Preprotein translocase subunit sece1 [Thalictrum thalictroides]
MASVSGFAFPTTFITTTTTTTTTNLTTRSHHYPFFKNPTRPIYSSSKFKHLRVIKAIEQSREENNRIEAEEAASSTEEEEKKSIEETTVEEKKTDDLWSGVVEEIKEIEWPVFGKVLGTTGVVLGVIAGSSVVLLTVNAIFAELSDRVFVGRGVQDFFG